MALSGSNLVEGGVLFNFLMSYSPEAWNNNSYEIETARYLEYTEEYIREKFKNLNIDTLELLKQMPTLFAIEGEQGHSRIGYIENIKVRGKHLYLEFQFDPILPPIPRGALVQLEKYFNISMWELNRTHWAIKDADMFFELIKAGYLKSDQVEAAKLFRTSKFQGRGKQNNIDVLNNDHVFIVHGHDDQTKQEVASFVRSVGLTPIILHEQANLGMTIIEKIETYTNVGFAVVIYTPCDLGSSKGEVTDFQRLKPRARQNVVLERGYLMAKLGRSRVAALVKGNIETPNDISGVVYIDIDRADNWKQSLKREFSVAGIVVT